MEYLDNAGNSQDVLDLNSPNISEASEPEGTSYGGLNEEGEMELRYQSPDETLSTWPSSKYRDDTISMKRSKLRKILRRVKKGFGRFDGAEIHGNLVEVVAEAGKRKEPIGGRQNDSIDHQRRIGSNLVSEEAETVSISRESPRKKNGSKHAFRSSLFDSLYSIFPMVKSAEVVEKDFQKEGDESQTAVEGECHARGRGESGLSEELKSGNAVSNFKWGIFPSLQTKIQERSGNFLATVLGIENQSEEESRYPSISAHLPPRIRVYYLYYSSMLSTRRVSGVTTKERSSILKRHIEAMYLKGKLASSRYLTRVRYRMDPAKRNNTESDAEDRDSMDSNSLKMESKSPSKKKETYPMREAPPSLSLKLEHDSNHEEEVCHESCHDSHYNFKSLHESIPEETDSASGHDSLLNPGSFEIGLEHESGKKGKDRTLKRRLFDSFWKDGLPIWMTRHQSRPSTRERESSLSEKPISLFKRAINIFDQPLSSGTFSKSHKEPPTRSSPSPEKGEQMTDSESHAESHMEQPSQTDHEENVNADFIRRFRKIKSCIKDIHRSDKSISLIQKDINTELNLKERMNTIILSQKDFLRRTKKLEIQIDDLHQTAQSVDLLLNESLAKASYAIQHVREEKHRTNIGKKLLWNFLFLVVILLTALLWMFSQLKKGVQKVYSWLQFGRRRQSRHPMSVKGSRVVSRYSV